MLCLYWEPSVQEKVWEFCKSGSIRKCFIFSPGLPSLKNGCPYCESFHMNYDKEGNSQNFSSMDNSQYTHSITCKGLIETFQQALNNTVQLIFNFTHARVQLWNYSINISIYSLITCEHSKEQ